MKNDMPPLSVTKKVSVKAKAARLILKALGWKLINENERMPDQYVIIVIPHTTNWDFPLGLLARAAIDEEVAFVGKDSLFKGVLGAVMRWLNGYPVDRSKRNNYVDAVADMFQSHESFKLCIAPEGTRKKVTELKTGFYYIALKANVPLILCRFDAGRRVIDFSKPFYPSGDKEKDFAFLRAHYEGVRGLRPENSFVWE